MTQKPNIVFIFTDDQRYDTIRALGNDHIITPNIDKLVENGTTFTEAYIPSGTSGAICMPSRAMLLTGRSLFHIQGAGEEIPVEHKILGETLRENGYYSYGIGKWHNGSDCFNRAFNNGSEIFFGGMADHWNVPASNYDPSGKYESYLPICLDPLFSNQLFMRQGDHVQAGRHSSDLLTDTAVEFLNNYKYDNSKPFFLYLSYLAPHDPRTMPKEFLEKYDPKEIPHPINFMEQHPFDNGALRERDELLAKLPRNVNEIKRHLAEYYAMITHLDYNIGRILKVLDNNDLIKNTIIVFTGDNGLALGQHGLMGKQNCYQHSNHVPLIFSGPNIPKNVKIDGQVYLFDIFPTICELIDIEIPESVEGKSLFDLFSDPSKIVREYLYFAFKEHQRAVKGNRYKLIEYVIKRAHVMTQLFDLQEDPYEFNNLATLPGNEENISRLRKKMVQLRDEWDDKDSKWGRRFWRFIEFERKDFNG